MLDAAEEIACDTGLGGLTLTAVQQRAGQANKSAAAYHFGSRTGLLSALTARRMGPIDEDRRQMLDALGPDCVDLRTLSLALVLPLARATIMVPGSRYARFLAQAFLDPQLGELVLGQPEGSSFREVRELMHRALSAHLDDALADARLASALAMVITTCALHEGHPDWGADPIVVDDLAATTLALLTAPAPTHAATPPHTLRRDA